MGWEALGKAPEVQSPFMRKPVGLSQLISDCHGFKASLLESPQRLKSIYFPADFSVTKVAPDSTYFPTGLWQWLWEGCASMGREQ